MKPKKPTKIIFIYNADSGRLNTILDTIHKTFSPKTYNCNLCKITFNTLDMKDDRKQFIDSLKIPIEFLHKDEFLKEYKTKKYRFPIILSEIDNKLQILINTQELNNLSSEKELIKLVSEKIGIKNGRKISSRKSR